MRPSSRSCEAITVVNPRSSMPRTPPWCKSNAKLPIMVVPLLQRVSIHHIDSTPCSITRSCKINLSSTWRWLQSLNSTPERPRIPKQTLSLCSTWMMRTSHSFLEWNPPRTEAMLTRKTLSITLVASQWSNLLSPQEIMMANKLEEKQFQCLS